MHVCRTSFSTAYHIINISDLTFSKTYLIKKNMIILWKKYNQSNDYKNAANIN